MVLFIRACCGFIWLREDFFVFFALWLDVFCFFFFFQAEDGIRDGRVTGVQTCALPISGRSSLVPLAWSCLWATIRQPSCAVQNASSRSRCEWSDVGWFSSSVEMRV